MKRTVLTALLCVVVCATTPAANPDGRGNECVGEISPPLGITIETPAPVAIGTPVTLTGTLRVEADAPVIELIFASGGPVTIQSHSAAPARPHFAGDEIPFTATVVYVGSGKASVSVTARAGDTLGTPLYSVRETLYALVAADRTLFGFGDFQALELKAIEIDLLSGRRTPDEADEARLALSRMQRDVTAAPAPPRTFSALERTLNALVGAPEGGYTLLAENAERLGGQITIQGNCQWQDENGNWHPVYGANIQIWDDDLGPDEFVDVVATDTNGNYSISVDNDDGIGAGDRDIYVRYLTANGWVDTQAMGGNTYASDSATYDETPSGTIITEDFAFNAGGVNDANSVFQAATWIAAYVAFDVEAGGFALVDVVWPNGGSGSVYTGGDVTIEQDDRYDWDTVGHEYGHYATDQIGIDSNPGGPHNIGDCIANVRGNKDEGNRLAWGEGWPTYFTLAGQAELNLASLNVPRVGDNSYQDVEDGSVVYSLESQDNNGRGEDNEVTVQRMLWDLFDNASDGRDTISLSDNSIWNSLKANAGDVQGLSRYWTGLRSGQSDAVQLMMGGVASDHLVGPRLNSPVAGSLVTPTNKSFNWSADVGCPASYGGDNFDLVFYDANTSAKILTVGGIGLTSYTLSLSQLQSLTAWTHNVLWAVEGRASGATATGPYLGENFAVTVNQPPVADAGTDAVEECTSPTTTPVTLDGTGSSDPDGDSLTYSWSAPGVAFDNPASATPTGQFPLTTTSATLTVNDGYQTDNDTVNVSVVDTTPPMIACPADIVVECTQHGGTPATDPQLLPFFAAVSATDVCDTTPVIANNAPGVFPHGATAVTFTATDDSNNASMCQATVTVVDTTPPEITLSVDPDVLWPPNHKLWTITATIEVFDICDPNPTVELTSIVSNEPDDGLGDGDTETDIDDADFGADDREFELRAERSGGGDGRVYTIVYTARDADDNTATAEATVVVPHNRNGAMTMLSGFAAGGAQLDPQAETFSIAVPSSADLDASRIDLDHLYVGNDLGVVQPVATGWADVTGDGLVDLVLTFEAAPVRALQQPGALVGMHYRSVDGDHYAVLSIFRLEGERPIIRPYDNNRTGRRGVTLRTGGITIQQR